MRIAIAFAILALLLVIIAVIVSKEHQAIYAMPLVQATGPEAKANQLFAPCPLTPANIPPRKEYDA